MFIAALFTTVKTWKQLKYPSTDDWIRTMWCVCVYPHYTYIMWIDVENIVISEISQRKANTM